MNPNPYDKNRSVAPRTPTLARRLLPVLAMGGAAGALVMALDHPGAGASSSALAVQDSLTVDTLAGDVNTIVTDPASSEVTSTVPAAPQRTGSSDPATTAAPDTTVRATTAPTGGSTCRTYRGPIEQNRFGPVQVQASVSGTGKICSVKVLQSPSGGKSTSINNYAVPILNKQAMAAQSTNIDGVSGATYTTIGYIDSLQAIIDAAKG